MDYARNEDYYLINQQGEGAIYNNVLDVLFVEDSGMVEVEPVTLAEALVQCNIDNLGQDNSLIEAYITAARMACESYTGIGFIQRNIQAVVNNSLGFIYLPYGPISDVSSVTNVDGIEQDFEAVGVKWKQLKTPALKRITVSYVGGYETLPQIFKTAILQQVAYLYEHRGDEKEGQFSPVSKSLLQPHRRC
jgi:hypothetical protein